MTQLQEVILNIFMEVSALCDRNKIPYFAIGGTCLGAVRHKGFIPWDDDMDIAIPIEHFDRFVSLARTELPEHLEVISSADLPHRFGVILRIADNRTTCILESMQDYPQEYFGLYLDVMPLAGIPLNEGRERLYKLYFNLLCRLDYVRRRPITEIPTVKGRICWHVLKTLSFCIRYNFFSNLWMGLLRKYPVHSAKYVGYVWSYKLWNGTRIFSKNDFDDHVDLTFENTTIHCPKGWDDFLTIFFGNYMEFPPVDQRIGHDNYVFVDLSKPYSFYQKKENRGELF